MTNASRAPVDLESFARDLQQPGAQAAPAAASKGDPLAELARIVGQDDPFRALLAARDERQAAAGQGGQAWQGRVEPTFAPEAPRPTPADAFDQYLASVDHAHSNDPAPTDPTAYAEPAPEAFDGRALKRSQPRRRLLTVGAGVAVVAVAVSGALAYKSLNRGFSGGGVPIVQADTSPLKVAPKVADGVEIPDQNRQIYEPKAKDKPVRIVNREEQPLDVAQAARAAQEGQPAPQAGNVTPGSAPSDVFGEPRRVRTVAVKPEAPPMPREDSVEPVVPAAIPTMTLPSEPQASPRTRSLRAATAMPQLTPTEPAPAQTTPIQTASADPSAVLPAPAPTRVKAPQRVAAVSPEVTVPVEQPTTTAATSPAVSNAAVGGFSVQLGVRNSAGEAQVALREMRAKYSQLSGKPELIRQAEVNGKTLYRVRVGPLGKSEAASLCSDLQGAGGQCFVAKN